MMVFLFCFGGGLSCPSIRDSDQALLLQVMLAYVCDPPNVFGWARTRFMDLSAQSSQMLGPEALEGPVTY